VERRVTESKPWQAEQVPRYGRDRKGLSPAVLTGLNEVQSRILQDPYRGDRKGGALRNVWVEKFKAENDQWLVAYTLFERTRRVRFLAVGQHENFYRDLTNYVGKQKEALKE